ncbi:hypothetical protein [Defluviicoccus vanus]|uniref:Uncharacterized protein n=1 Tax=Defluviicoccus vanus TaxID=111831 RepID=A0A7H1N3B7_9PROT|nr:hypothetical protein [Defluviicoccus vanus]QNT70203.1 hypothetical protein HQ394_13810 [Defluviicoccus vanus]
MGPECEHEQADRIVPAERQDDEPPVGMADAMGFGILNAPAQILPRCDAGSRRLRILGSHESAQCIQHPALVEGFLRETVGRSIESPFVARFLDEPGLGLQVLGNIAEYRFERTGTEGHPLEMIDDVGLTKGGLDLARMGFPVTDNLVALLRDRHGGDRASSFVPVTMIFSTSW